MFRHSMIILEPLGVALLLNLSLMATKRSVRENGGAWKSPGSKEFLGITGFYEGSIVFGNRFKDIDYSLLSKLASIKKEQLMDASDFVKKSLGSILHDDEGYYSSLYVMKNQEAKKIGL